MMPPDTATAKPPPKDDTPPSSATTRKAAPPSSSAKQPSPEQQSLKCPRCDSSNTKFCYYNNYSLTQPRHFCKTCRRYWTKGGALRNVPIGGGCRKNKKVKSSSSSTNTNLHHLSVVVDPKDCSDFGGGLNLKYFSGLTPAVDFHLPSLPAFPARVHSSSTSGGPYGQFPPPFSDVPPPPPSSSFLTTPPPPPPRFPLDSSSGSFLGFNYPLPGFSTNNNPNTNNQGDQIGTNLNINSSIASSIESLSSINQDLHWKLQQQRLSMLFGSNGENTQKEDTTVVPTSVSNIETAPDHHHQVVKPQHATFLVQNHDNNSLTKQADVAGNSRKDGDAATEWFFGNSYAPTDSDGNGDGNGGAWSSGIQAWSGGGGRNLNQFTALP